MTATYLSRSDRARGDRLPVLAVEGPVGIEGLAVLVVEEKRGVGDLEVDYSPEQGQGTVPWPGDI